MTGNIRKIISIRFNAFTLAMLLLVMLTICLQSCIDDLDDNAMIMGMKPIYSQEINEIVMSEARPIAETGKIVYLTPYIFISEENQGIHVIDNSDPSDPHFVNFIEVPYTLDFTIKDDIIYAQSGRDIVSILLKEDSVSVLERVEDVVLSSTQRTPGIEYSGYFECVDLSKGYVSGWEEALLNNPKCFK